MGRITVELIRKRAEHNDGEIQSLEELALHQEKLEKIEMLDRVCRKLRILLLQNNAISKIENLGRLKNLEYLNLALNMVEKIENLDGCESLKKLDLTLNFIGELSSVKSLRSNYYLEQLYLVGNPCHDYPGYREYVVAVLPQLKQLDGAEITKSERIQARQKFEEIEARILLFEEACLKEKQEAKAKSAQASGDNDTPEPSKTIDKNGNEDEDDDGFWSKVTENTPEARLEMSRQLEKQEARKNAKKASALSKPKVPRKLEAPDGRPLNTNEPKLSFTLHDEMERNQIVLDLAVPKFLCTTLIDADVQPTHVKVMVKGKVFQLVLPEEVKPDASYAQRSQTTGHLIVTMPKIHENSTLIWRGGSGQVIDLRKDHASKEPPTNKIKLKARPATAAVECKDNHDTPTGEIVTTLPPQSPQQSLNYLTQDSSPKLRRRGSILKSSSTNNSVAVGTPSSPVYLTGTLSAQTHNCNTKKSGGKLPIRETESAKLSVRWKDFEDVPPLM